MRKIVLFLLALVLITGILVYSSADINDGAGLSVQTVNTTV